MFRENLVAAEKRGEDLERLEAKLHKLDDVSNQFAARARKLAEDNKPYSITDFFNDCSSFFTGKKEETTTPLVLPQSPILKKAETKRKVKRPAPLAAVISPLQKPISSSLHISQQIAQAMQTEQEIKFIENTRLKLTTYLDHLKAEARLSRWFYDKEPLNLKIITAKQLWYDATDLENFKLKWEQHKAVLATHRPFTLFGCIRFNFTSLFGFQGNSLVKNIDKQLQRMDTTRPLSFSSTR
jgi:hypothetical protein